MGGDLTLLLPMGAALVVACAALSLDAWGSRRAAVIVSSVGLMVAAGLSAMGVGVEAHSVLGAFGAGSALSAIVATVLFCGGLALLGGIDELSEHPRGGALAALAVLATMGAAAAAVSMELVALLVAIEIASVCAYGIVALGSGPRAAEASMKYFIQGAVATGFFMLGTALLVGLVAGTGSYQGLVDAFAQALERGAGAPAVVGVLLIASVLAFKAGAFPFHSWAPDAYEAASPTGAAVLAGAVKSGALFALTVAFGLVSASGASRFAVAGIAIGSIVFGNIAALKQTSYQRMLAYSGIAQAGYALVAILAYPVQQQAVFFVITYAIAATGSFAAAAAFKRADPAWDGSISGLAGMGSRLPLVSGSLAVLLLSLVGVPPLLGFWGKLYAFSAAIATIGWPLGVTLAIVGLLGSVVSFGYYGRVLRSLYFEEPTDESSAKPTWGSAGIATVIAAVLVVSGGVATLAMGVRFLGFLLGV